MRYDVAVYVYIFLNVSPLTAAISFCLRDLFDIRATLKNIIVQNSSFESAIRYVKVEWKFPDATMSKTRVMAVRDSIKMSLVGINISYPSLSLRIARPNPSWLYKLFHNKPFYTYPTVGAPPSDGSNCLQI
ncbi:hypothetical protein GQX74_006566 [Glossina fuscipes]|nr:hypothetical protein GQX74_006566 [Glossina fuscipes]